MLLEDTEGEREGLTEYVSIRPFILLESFS